ncbi:MAG: carotenoid biosynthesis protein [Euzebya sp.]
MTQLLRRLGPSGRSQPRHLAPAVLGVCLVAAQISYPHTAGDTRDRLTILTVVLFASASLSHALIAHGRRTTLWLFGVFAGGGMLVEALGVATGFPFGDYAYSQRIGPALIGVPMIIPLAWVMMGYPAAVVARLITPRRWLGAIIGAGALATWDLFLDPQMVAEGYWTWQGAGPHLIGSIPATNYLAWLAVAGVMMTVVWPATTTWSVATADHRVPVALYVWTWFGSVIGHVAYLGLPQSGLYGGVGMGVFVVWLTCSLLRSSRMGSEGQPVPSKRARL